METKGKTDQELWRVLEDLDDDLLDLDVPEALVDEELKAMGVDPLALAKRGSAFVVNAKEDERLSWQARARERRAQLQERASKVATRVPADMDRERMLARLDELRANPSVGSAIKMAARKRRPEASTHDELRALLEEMEALRAIEGNDPE